MSRPGAILIPLLLGFTLTFALLSWRSGGWRRSAAASVDAPPRIQQRHSPLRAVGVDLHAVASRARTAEPVAAAPATPPPAAVQPLPEPVWEPPGPPPVPRVDPGNSREQLEAPARKFARGGNAGGP